MCYRACRSRVQRQVQRKEFVSPNIRWQKCLIAAKTFDDGLMEGFLKRANIARAQSTRMRRTIDRERIVELPTLVQFRAGDAYNCMTLCVCVSLLPKKTCVVLVCVLACDAVVMSLITRVLQVFTTS